MFDQLTNNQKLALGGLFAVRSRKVTTAVCSRAKISVGFRHSKFLTALFTGIGIPNSPSTAWYPCHTKLSM